MLNGQQGFGEKEIVCEIEATFSASTMNWVEMEKEKEWRGGVGGRVGGGVGGGVGGRGSRSLEEEEGGKKLFFLSIYSVISKEV